LLTQWYTDNKLNTYIIHIKIQYNTLYKLTITIYAQYMNKVYCLSYGY